MTLRNCKVLLTSADGSILLTTISGGFDLSAAPLIPDQTGNAGKYLGTDGTDISWGTPAGGGDMLVADYDPQGIIGDAFDVDNHTDGATNKVFTATEKTKLAGIETSADVTDTANVKSAISGASIGSSTVATDDKVLIQDTDDADNLRTVTAQSIADLASAAGVADGDKGDVTVSSSGTVWTIDASAVSNSKLADMAADTIKGRANGAGTGAPQDLTATQVRTILNVEDGAQVNTVTSSSTTTFTNKTFDANGTGNSISNLEVADFAGTAIVTASETLASSDNDTSIPTTAAVIDAIAAVGGISDGDKGDITVSAGGTTWTVDNDAVTYAKIQNVSATDKLLGRSTAGSGDVEEIACTAAGRAILDDADATAQRATLGLVIGTNVQAYDADLDSWATKTAPSGTVVGTSDSQTLTNKTLTTPVINGLPTGTGIASAATASTLVSRDASANTAINNVNQGYTTTATAAGTTTLTVASTYLQLFTGTTTQNVDLPVASTLVLGHQFYIKNNSTGLVTIRSSGGNTVRVLGAGTRAIVTCILTSGTTAASWSSTYTGINITDGKVLASTNSLTLAGTDGTTMTFPSATGTVATLAATQTFTNKTLTSPTLTTPVLGTPSSGTLTNCTGLPVAGIAASTSTALGVGSVELGHASDTTLSRSAAGVLAVEGVVVPTISSTNTFTNKRVTKRVGTTTSSATPTINTDNVDMYTLTAQAVDITSFTTNLSGTPTDGQTLLIAITGTAARAITWGASFEASGTVALPTTTVSTTRLDVAFIWNASSNKWRCVGTA